MWSDSSSTRIIPLTVLCCDCQSQCSALTSGCLEEGDHAVTINCTLILQIKTSTHQKNSPSKVHTASQCCTHSFLQGERNITNNMSVHRALSGDPSHPHRVAHLAPMLYMRGMMIMPVLKQRRFGLLICSSLATSSCCGLHFPVIWLCATEPASQPEEGCPHHQQQCCDCNAQSACCTRNECSGIAIVSPGTGEAGTGAEQAVAPG